MPYDPPIEPPAPTVREFEHAIHEISDALGCGCTVYDCTRAAAALRAEVERLTEQRALLVRDRLHARDRAEQAEATRDDAQAKLAALCEAVALHARHCDSTAPSMRDALAALDAADPAPAETGDDGEAGR